MSAVAETGTGASWGQLTVEALDLATRIEERFAADLHHIIGTIRTDGSPRLSGTEVRIVDREVTIGMMSGSRKLRDVQRDPRVEIQAALVEDDLARGDAKQAGVLTGAAKLPGPVRGVSFRLAITLAGLVRVDGDELSFTVWRPGEAVRRIRRS